MSLFEPDQPDPPFVPASPMAGERPLIPPVPAPPRRRRAWLLVGLALALAVGTVLGLALAPRQRGGALTATTTPAPAPVTSVVVRPTASPACLEMATKADQLIDLLVKNRRGQAADLLVAYTIASRQCRRDASP